MIALMTVLTMTVGIEVLDFLESMNLPYNLGTGYLGLTADLYEYRPFASPYINIGLPRWP